MLNFAGRRGDPFSASALLAILFANSLFGCKLACTTDVGGADDRFAGSPKFDDLPMPSYLLYVLDMIR